MLQDYTVLTFPDNYKFIAVDTSEYPSIRKLPSLVMKFWIEYPDIGSDAPTPTPPVLIMVVNPRIFSKSETQKISPNFARYGFVIERWGPNQMTLSFEGILGAFMSMDEGLTRYNKIKTESFKRFQELVLLYKNNGMIYKQAVNYIQKPSGKPILIKEVGKFTNKGTNTSLLGLKDFKYRVGKQKGDSGNDVVTPFPIKYNNRIDKVGSIFLSYDDTIYRGSFQDFSYEEVSEKPFSISYKFTFIVRDYTELDLTRSGELEFTSYTQGGTMLDNTNKMSSVYKPGTSDLTKFSGVRTAWKELWKPVGNAIEEKLKDYREAVKYGKGPPGEQSGSLWDQIKQEREDGEKEYQIQLKQEAEKVRLKKELERQKKEQG